MEAVLSTLFCLLLAHVNISRIKTIPRLEGAGASPVGLRAAGSWARLGPSPVARPRPPCPSRPRLVGPFGLGPFGRPDLTKQPFCSKASIEQKGCCCSVGAGAVGPSLRAAARASPCAPPPRRGRPSVPGPCLAPGWSRVLFLVARCCPSVPPAATPPGGAAAAASGGSAPGAYDPGERPPWHRWRSRFRMRG